MPAHSLRETTVPRYALRRSEAAASLAISPSTFDQWVEKGMVPKGKKIGGVVLWDAECIRSAWLLLSGADEVENDDGENPFDTVVA